MYVSEPYRNCVELQRLILNDARSAELKPLVRAGIARAFCELEECKRKLKMKPLPGSLRPTEAKSKRKAREPVSFTLAQEDGGDLKGDLHNLVKPKVCNEPEPETGQNSRLF